MNEPPGARPRVGRTGWTIAEHFRDAEGVFVIRVDEEEDTKLNYLATSDIMKEKFPEIKTPEYGDLGFSMKLRSHASNDIWGRSTKSLNGKDMVLRADKVDLDKLDVELENHLIPIWSHKFDKQFEKEVWGIDMSKVDIKSFKARGTYGAIYRGTYNDQDVAVKLLDWGEDGKATAAKAADLRARFQKEVAVWHKLDHPNVTKFVGASMGPSDVKIPLENSSTNQPANLPARACCFVVEYLPGGTLKEFLHKNRIKKLPFKTVVQLALDLARGLSYLHSNNIVHRDVKLENLLLDAHRTLKIADFGVARVEAQNPKDMTGVTGTIGYMAPEVIDGKPYNRKCDVYSFAICLWEIYCCELPYGDLSFADAASQIVQQNLRPEIPKCCPSAFANIMRQCWDAKPEKRPNMEEVVKMLDAIDTSKGGGMIPEDQAVGCFCFAPTCRGP